MSLARKIDQPDFTPAELSLESYADGTYSVARSTPKFILKKMLRVSLQELGKVVIVMLNGGYSV